MNQCNDITVNFRQPSDRITVGDIIGIEDGDEVDIRCDCSGPRGSTAVWTRDNNDISTERNENAQIPYIEVDGGRSSLRIPRFEEDSEGEYICDSRDTTVEFNLVRYDPSELYSCMHI